MHEYTVRYSSLWKMKIVVVQSVNIETLTVVYVSVFRMYIISAVHVVHSVVYCIVMVLTE